MASLIEELIDVLEKENTEYEELLALSTEKTSYIVKGDVESLQKLVEKEQLIVGRVNSLEKKRSEVANDISNVLNIPETELTVRRLIVLLKEQVEEKTKLENIYTKLRRTLDNIARINKSNSQLIQESLDMIEFELNLAQSLRMSPQTANYSRGAYGEANSYQNNGFDAKQ